MSRKKRQSQLFALPSDRVEFLQPKADRINQPVTTGAALVTEVNLQALTARHGLPLRQWGKARADTGRRRRNLLAKKVFPDKESALGGRGFFRLTGERQECGLTQ